MAGNNSTLIDEIKMSKDLLGEDGIIQALKNARLEKFNNDHTVYVINTVITAIDIELGELKKNNSRSDKRKVSIGLCAYFLNSIFDYSYKEISQNMCLGLDSMTIFNYAKAIKEAKVVKPVSDIDKIISVHIHTLSEIFSKYKTQYDAKNK